jgi:hypothetical protein
MSCTGRLYSLGLSRRVDSFLFSNDTDFLSDITTPSANDERDILEGYLLLHFIPDTVLHFKPIHNSFLKKNARNQV